MATYQQTVDDIRLFLQSDDRQMNDQLASLATNYDAFCREANERLRRCGEHLRQELRAEAIQLAESQPNLLDLVALLDFPERADWESLTSMYDLKRPTPLLQDVAQALNEAYSELQPLEDLMVRHRLLALGQGPLTDRIEVLRTLVAKDPNSTHWQDDLREFERARLRQIEADARSAAAQGDAARIKSILDELRSDTWTELPPEEMLVGIQKLAGRVVRSSSRKELERLEAEMDDAFRRMDESRLRTLAGQWQVHVGQSRLPPDDPLMQRVQPILGWLADQDQQRAAEQSHRAAVSALEGGLEAGAGQERLEQLFADASRSGEILPDMLTERYRSRLQALQSESRLRRRLFFGGIGTALLALVVVFVLVVRAKSGAIEVERLIATVEGYLQENDCEQALTLLDSRPEMATLPAIQELRARVKKAASDIAEQTVRFDAAYRAAEGATTWAEARPHLELATTLAATPQQRSRVDVLMTERKRVDELENVRKESAIRQQIGAIRDQVSALEAKAKSVPWDDSTRKLFEEVNGDVRRLAASTRELPETMQTLSNDALKLTERITNVSKLDADFEKQQRLLQEVTANSAILLGTGDSASKLARYQKALESYAAASPSDPRSEGFKRVLAEFPIVQSAVDWQSLLAEWKSLAPADAAAAARRRDQIQEFRGRYPVCPMADSVAAYAAYIGPLSDRNNPESGALTELKKVFESPLVHDTWMLETKDGRRYYVDQPGDASVQARTVTISYFIGFNGETRPNKLLLRDDLKDLRAVPAPQASVARAVLSNLDSLKPAEWEGHWLSVADDVRNREGLDPVLKFTLIKRILELAGQGSAPFRDVAGAALTQMNGARIDVTTKWMDPDNRSAPEAREAAERALEDLKSLDELRTPIAARAAEIEKQVFQRATIVGWLVRNSSDKWHCRTSFSPDQDYQLWVATSSSDAAQWTFVGELTKKSSGAVDATGLDLPLATTIPSAALVEGRPVFATPNEGSTSAPPQSRGSAAPLATE